MSDELSMDTCFLWRWPLLLLPPVSAVLDEPVFGWESVHRIVRNEWRQGTAKPLEDTRPSTTDTLVMTALHLGA